MFSVAFTYNLYYLASQEEQSQGPLLIMEGGGGAGTDTRIDTGADTGTETGTDGGNRTTDGGTHAKEKKKQRARCPNKPGTRRLVVHSVNHGNFEPESPRDVSAGYGNNVGCILRETVNLNEGNIREKPALEHLLLTRLHARYLFPSQNDEVHPWEDDTIEKINQKAINQFSNLLSS